MSHRNPKCVIFFLLIFLAGCNSLEFRTSTAEYSALSFEQRVAMSFVDILSQVPELAPSEITILSGPRSSDFGEYVFEAIKEAGYEVNNSSKSVPLMHDQVRTIGSDDNVFEYVVSIGETVVSRSFSNNSAKGNEPAPTSPVFLSGVVSYTGSIDDGMFFNSDSNLSYVEIKSKISIW